MPVGGRTLDDLIMHYSSLNRLLRAVVWLSKFKDRLQKRKGVQRELAADDIEASEEIVVRYVQQTSYQQERQALSQGKNLSPQSSVYRLEPWLSVSGVLGVGGRLHETPIDDEAKHPAILPRNHHLSSLIVSDAHCNLSKHPGQEHIMSVVRNRYWIPKCQTLVRQVLRRCVLCKRLRGPLAKQ